MRWPTMIASGGAGMLVALSMVWAAGGFLARETSAQESGTIAGWVYWAGQGYDYPYGAAGEVPAGQPTDRAEVDENGVLPPAAPPEGGTAPDGSTVRCLECPQPVYYCCWPVPVEGALVAVQGTALSARSDQDGWFMIEGVPLGIYHTIAATVPGGARLVTADPTTQQPGYLLPYARGAFALRGNVVVNSTVKPTNLGALFVGRAVFAGTYYPDTGVQPMPGQTEPSVEGGAEGEPEGAP